MTARVVYIGAPEATAAEFLDHVRDDFPDLDVYATDDRSLALCRLGQAEVVIGHHFQFDNTLIVRAPKLRWIQALTTGTDAILKIAGLPRDVVITSTRGVHGPQMSELVFLQMMALSRDFPRVLRNQQKMCWERWPQPLLLNKTAVIVGVGAISETLAVRCKAFGMKVYGVSSSRREAQGFDVIYQRTELRHAASLADFLVVLVPLTKETQNFIDRSVLESMRPGAYLINVARGGVLDETALIECLHAKKIAGAALDVFRHMPLPIDDPLWREERVIITPLLGGMSDVYLEQAYPYVRDNLRHFLDNHPERMVNVVQRCL